INCVQQIKTTAFEYQLALKNLILQQSFKHDFDLSPFVNEIELAFATYLRGSIWFEIKRDLLPRLFNVFLSGSVELVCELMSKAEIRGDSVSRGHSKQEARSYYLDMFVPRIESGYRGVHRPNEYGPRIFVVGDREKRLLYPLWQQAGKAISRVILEEFVYIDKEPGPNAFHQLRSKVNKKLFPHGAVIELDDKFGYSLVAQAS
ncbi:MAG: hypothetical protein AAGA30_09615, partial [Planctomycetota bacterium]